MAKRIKTQKELILQDVWRQVWVTGAAKIIPFKTHGDAVRGRLSLYRAVKLAKQDLDEDFVLNQAAQGIEIGWHSKTELIMRRIDDSDFMRAIEQAVGRPMTSYQDTSLLESQEKVQKMIDELGLVEPPPKVDEPPAPDEVDPITGLSKVHKKNPFYDR
jgi:hypothetical protein